LLVSGRAELGGPQFSKRPTVHLKLALPRAAGSWIRSLVPRELTVPVAWNLTVAWKVSEGEPTCPASSFFEIQLLALLDLHSVLMHLAGPLSGIRSVLRIKAE
jgi:hypothetical protein